jgi:biopolymer transport protein ExbD
MFKEINVTPLTDVFLVLLVIMILTSRFANPTVLKVDPALCHCGERDSKILPINVEVAALGQIEINGKTLVAPDSACITAAIQAEQKRMGKRDVPVFVSAEPDAAQKHVVAVMDAAAGAGIKQLRLLPLKYK